MVVSAKANVFIHDCSVFLVLVLIAARLRGTVTTVVLVMLRMVAARAAAEHLHMFSPNKRPSLLLILPAVKTALDEHVGAALQPARLEGVHAVPRGGLDPLVALLVKVRVVGGHAELDALATGTAGDGVAAQVADENDLVVAARRRLRKASGQRVQQCHLRVNHSATMYCIFNAIHSARAEYAQTRCRQSRGNA